MKTTIYILVVLAILLYSSKPTVHFKPFSVNFESLLIPFAVLFLSGGLILFSLDFYNRGYKSGVKDINKYYTLTKK